MIGDVECHRWRAAQRLMHAAKIVERDVKADGRKVAVDLLVDLRR